VSGELTADDPLIVIYGRLKVDSPPVDGEVWTNGFGMVFEWVAGRHAARLPVSAALFERFRERSGELLPFYPATVRFSDPDLVGEQKAIYVTRDAASRFCEWLTATSRNAGYLTERHDYVLNEDADAELVAADFSGVTEELVLLMCAVEQSEFVLATFTTNPDGAEIYVGERRVGTGGEALMLETGMRGLTFIKPGYQPFDLLLDVVPGEEIRRDVTLVATRAAVLGRAWENDLGMRFVPLGDELLIGEHEVRVVDFRRFTDQSLTEWNHTPPFLQSDEHPVVKVKLQEAVAFCAWLTSVDLESGMLEPGFEYRLPRDLEWSRAAGLPIEPGATPASRDGRVTNHFPWGPQWPPPDGVANLSDDHGVPGRATIEGYSDGFRNTAPVGSFVSNAFGIYDLSGNVWEWVEEPYGGAGDLKGVMRGGGFSNAKVSELESSCRNPVGLGVAGELNGFRIVVAKSDNVAEE
ncbi:MAG: SUMF1/EgtB/PvdO family nonheme iron enzyme, partial [Verrucomicrobiales bacterium]